MKLPEDPEVYQLRAQLAAQRQRKSGALSKHKQTTTKAVECCNTPTTFLDPVELRKRLTDDDESLEEVEGSRQES